jgi:hypothetical protein
MSLSHSRKTPSTIPVLSGPDVLREYFAPRQRLRLWEAAKCIDLSYSRFFRRIQAGTLNLRVRTDELGSRYVLLDDLISYIFFPADIHQPDTDPHSLQPSKKRGPGRPRKCTGGPGK